MTMSEYYHANQERIRAMGRKYLDAQPPRLRYWVKMPRRGFPPGVFASLKESVRPRDDNRQRAQDPLLRGESTETEATDNA